VGRALITGGAGFIGSHLAEALLDAGHEVDVIDDLSTGSIDNIAHLKGRPRFRYTIDSVTKRTAARRARRSQRHVFHLAAAVGVKLIVERPVHTIETNVHGTEVVLTHANKKKKLVVIASTSEVYGKSADVPFREDADLVMGRPRSTGGRTRAARRSTSFWPWRTGRRRSCRSSSCGSSTRSAPARPASTAWSCHVRPPGAGRAADHGVRRRHAVRSFTYVGDVVDCLLKLMGEPGAIGEVFNIGNAEEITILGWPRR